MSKASRKLANLTERKNPHTPVNDVKKFVRLSVTNFDPNYLGTGRREWAEKFLGHLWQNECCQKILFVRKAANRAGAEGQNAESQNSSVFFILT